MAHEETTVGQKLWPFLPAAAGLPGACEHLWFHRPFSLQLAGSAAPAKEDQGESSERDSGTPENCPQPRLYCVLITAMHCTTSDPFIHQSHTNDLSVMSLCTTLDNRS